MSITILSGFLSSGAQLVYLNPGISVFINLDGQYALDEIWGNPADKCESHTSINAMVTN